MNNVDVLFVVRGDAVVKPGGDTAKVERYRQELGKLGIATRVVHRARDMGKFSPRVCHLVNLDLPIENAIYATAARSRDIPVVLSTVSHPIAGLMDFYDYGADSFYVRARRTRLHASRGIPLRESLKLLKRGVPNLPLLSSLHQLQQDLITLCDHVLPMAQSEDNDLRRRFQVGNSTTIPNGINFAQDVTTDRVSKRYDFVAIGRIEPRKNSVELARTLACTPFRAAFAGAVNSNHPRYIKEFFQVIQASERIEYLGKLGRDEVRALLRCAAGYVNASWMEVVSQADIEAASLGIPVMSTRHSYLRDFIGSGYAPLEPKDFLHTSVGAEALTEARQRQVGDPTLASTSWSDAAARLAGVYSRFGVRA